MVLVAIDEGNIDAYVAFIFEESDADGREFMATIDVRGAVLRRRQDYFFLDGGRPAASLSVDRKERPDGSLMISLSITPKGGQVPAMLAALARPGSEAHLLAIFDRQFAGAERELHNTAASLGLFGAQYIAQQDSYSEDEKQHYTQLMAAASAWGTKAPLGDRQRAKQAIGQLAGAARRTGLASEADFAKAGMAASLRKVSGFSAALKQVLVRYGLDLDAGLGTLDATLLQQTGDQARVRMRYQFAGKDIDTVVSLRRIDGRWYLEDFLRHAEEALGPPAVDGKDATVPAPAPTGAARR